MIDIRTLSQLATRLRRRSAVLAPGTQSVALFSKLCMDRGEGAVLWDVDGNRYVGSAGRRRRARASATRIRATSPR